MKYEAEKYLPRFIHLIKNRLGPYHIVFKNEREEYIDTFNCWGSLDNCFQYDEAGRTFLSFNYRRKELSKSGDFYLTTAAGDIMLQEGDFSNDL